MSRLILLLVVSTAFAADTYRIAGVIVDSQTGNPIANSSLALSSEDATQSAMVTASGADGRFAFDAPRGKYMLSAVVAGFSHKFGAASPVAGQGCAVITGPDQDTGHLVFRWFRPAVITGRVVDEHGNPVESARVHLFYSGVAAGREVITATHNAQTNDRGDYRIWPVGGGSYYVAVTATPWWDSLGDAGLSASDRATGYPEMYYPGTTDLASATALAVRPGEEARADFTLTVTAGAKVTVTCDNCGTGERAAGETTLSVIAQDIGGAETQVMHKTVYGWPVELAGLLPRRYLLRMLINGPGASSMAERWIEVGAGDISVSLSLRPPSAVAGKVTFKTNGPPPSAHLMVSLDEESGKWRLAAMVRPDGTIRISPVRPGKYVVSVFGGGYYAHTVRAGDTTLPEGVLDVEDGAESRVAIVAANEAGRLQGFATRDGQPMANMLVVLVAVGAASGYSNQGFQTDSDGSFDWKQMRAGDYLLFAVDDPTIAYADAKAIEHYLARAKAIHIEPGKTYEERVPVERAAK